MSTRELDPDCVDLEDERFRISEDLEPPRLAESLRLFGQLNPVHLLEGEGSRLAVICGFRRVRALARIGRNAVWARLWSSTECDTLGAFRIALWDNLAHRCLNALEIARVLFSLCNVCGVSQEVVVEEYLPLLGLNAHKNVLRSYLALHKANPAIREMLREGRITLATAERASALRLDLQEKMAEVFQSARWSASLQRDVLDMAEELALVQECSLGELFDRAEVVSVLKDGRLSASQKGERIHDLLYRWRHPRLSRAKECFNSERTKLGLPSQVRFLPDPFFESPRLRVEFEVSTLADFRKIAEALQRAGHNTALEKLFHVC